MVVDAQQDRNSNECHFCATVSKANGEDPIGTAGTYDQFLLVETPQPWSYQIWKNDPSLQLLTKRIQTLSRRKGTRIRLMGIAPDREYSQSDRIRVIHYAQPKSPFAQLEKQEFLIPKSELLALAEILITRPDQIEHFQSFEAYRQDTHSIRDILICTHASHDLRADGLESRCIDVSGRSFLAIAYGSGRPVTSAVTDLHPRLLISLQDVFGDI